MCGTKVLKTAKITLKLQIYIYLSLQFLANFKTVIVRPRDKIWDLTPKSSSKLPKLLAKKLGENIKT